MVNVKITIGFLLISLVLVQGQSGSCGRSDRANQAGANANSTANVAKTTRPGRNDTKQTNNDRAKPQGSANTATRNMSNTPDEAPDEVKKRGAQNVVPLGTWGGDHIRLVVNAEGADIEYDCAQGSIIGKLSLDGERRFNLTGTHAREGPGPIRIGRSPSSRPARYAGTVRGDEMSLTVTLTDTSEALGTFTLTRGSEGRLRKCR